MSLKLANGGQRTKGCVQGLTFLQESPGNGHMTSGRGGDSGTPRPIKVIPVWVSGLHPEVARGTSGVAP